MRGHFNYLRPDCVTECLDILDQHGTETAILAGGTDVMISLRTGVKKPRIILDISRLPETRLVEPHGETVRVGSTLTYSELIDHPVIRQEFPALRTAMGCVGSLQIRNVGTLGGNIANSSPAADSLPPMMLRDAEIIIQKKGSSRIQKLEKLIVGAYSNTLESDELITGIILRKIKKGYRESYQRIGRRKSLSIARINAAILGRLNDSGVIEDARISVGSVAPSPMRMTNVESHLKGRKPELKTILEASRMIAQEIIDLVGVRHSTEYKQPAITGLALKCLEDVFLDSSVN
ncbi:MAG: xanthine dehydrogenase family protein subunit M [Desulfomonile sp.]